jgi:hypothetical protein
MATNDITTAFVQQYGRNIDILSQQRGSVLRNFVKIRPGVVGRTAYFDQLDATAAVQKTVRNTDTPLIKSVHKRRQVTLYDWVWADLLDKEDQLKMLIDPTSDYVMNAAFALGRAIDDTIIAAFWADAVTGQEGASTESLPSANKVTAGTTAMTLAKLLQGKAKLDNADVDMNISRHIAITGTQLSDLLNTTEIKDADYNSVKALVNGEVNSFLGFNFHLCNRLTASSSVVRLCPMWVQDGVALAIAKDLTHRIEERSDKNYATQVFSSMGIGATRLEEAKVIQIQCYES